MNDHFWGKLGVIIQYLALRDQCQNLSNNGYSTRFCLEVMPKIEELINDRIFPHGDLFDFWVKQTKK